MNMLVTLNKETDRMKTVLEMQRKAYRAIPMPSRKARIAGLKRLKKSLLKHKEELNVATDEDFSSRSDGETFLMETAPAVSAIKFTIGNLKKWMKPSRRSVPFPMLPTTAKIMYQPLGVVGILVPWNFPIGMALQPLICALGAGNRAMIKLSEFTPSTNEVLRKILSEAFADDEVAIFTGEADVAAAFSKLPFDHMVFTGSTAVGRHVMRAAADNLTPVTLELGGKSPAIIDDKVPLSSIMDRLVFGKSINGGQTCISPDYILCPAARRGEVVEHFVKNFAKMYPSLRNNKDFTAIINDRQYQRLQSYLVDAEEKGATIIPVNPGNEDLKGVTRKMEPHLILDPTEDMLVMQEEIFGPILPIKTYRTIDEAIDYINDHERPLALYLFSYSKALQTRFCDETHSGSISFNEAVLQAGVDSVPFGGIGASGMGHYHGWEGFETLSKAKPVINKGRINLANMVYAPFGQPFHKVYFWLHLR